MIRRLLLAAVLGLAVGALIAPSAAAEKPLKEPLPFDDLTGQFCEDFLVLVHATSNKEVLHLFSSGEALITGVLKVEVTNLETGKTLALNISGPGKFSADGSTLSGSGRWLLFGEPGDFGPGSGSFMTLVAGRLEITFDEEGGVTGLTTQGHVEDICAALAAD